MIKNSIISKYLGGVGVKQKEQIENYVKILLEYNIKTNLISRQIKEETLYKLLSETIFLEKYIKNNIVVDAGSGNGILGIPIAILNRDKSIVLVEAKKKKVEFLNIVKGKLLLEHLSIYHIDINEFFNKEGPGDTSLISRGFPNIKIFFKFLSKRLINELILITSAGKIKKIKKSIEKFEQKIYNIRFRDNLKILKLENVSRETKS